MERRFHTDTRTSENFTEDGLVSLTGEDSRKWGRYIVKELLDNALESSPEEHTPEITVTCESKYDGYSRHATSITVEDNGPGITDSRLKEIFADPEQFGGTKRHYALPTRGNQGNALMTVLGIQHVCGEPLALRTNGQGYRITAEENVRTGEYEISIDPAAADGGSSVAHTPAVHTENDTGTAVTVDFSSHGKLYSSMVRIEDTVREFVTLNPPRQFRVHSPLRYKRDVHRDIPRNQSVERSNHVARKERNDGKGDVVHL